MYTNQQCSLYVSWSNKFPFLMAAMPRTPQSTTLASTTPWSSFTTITLACCTASSASWTAPSSPLMLQRACCPRKTSPHTSPGSPSSPTEHPRKSTQLEEHRPPQSLHKAHLAAPRAAATRRALVLRAPCLKRMPTVYTLPSSSQLLADQFLWSPLDHTPPTSHSECTLLNSHWRCATAPEDSQCTLLPTLPPVTLPVRHSSCPFTPQPC